MNDAKIDVTGMPEFDALLDHIYEYGTASEGTIDHANTFARAIIAQARAELIAELKPVVWWNGVEQANDIEIPSFLKAPDAQHSYALAIIPDTKE